MGRLHPTSHGGHVSLWSHHGNMHAHDLRHHHLRRVRRPSRIRLQQSLQRHFVRNLLRARIPRPCCSLCGTDMAHPHFSMGIQVPPAVDVPTRPQLRIALSILQGRLRESIPLLGCGHRCRLRLSSDLHPGPEYVCFQTPGYRMGMGAVFRIGIRLRPGNGSVESYETLLPSL